MEEEEYKEKVRSRVFEAFKKDLPNTFESNVKECNEYDTIFINKCFHTALDYRNFNFVSSVLCYHKYFKPDFSFQDYSLLIKLMTKSDLFYFEDMLKHIDINEINFNDFIFSLFEHKKFTNFLINRIKSTDIINQINPNLKNAISRKPIDIDSINKELKMIHSLKHF
tara:strand:- start:4177 stop:4677 length:501 start_codon:yes stop_codon:yes gene_type:complete